MVVEEKEDGDAVGTSWVGRTRTEGKEGGRKRKAEWRERGEAAKKREIMGRASTLDWSLQPGEVIWVGQREALWETRVSWGQEQLSQRFL